MGNAHTHAASHLSRGRAGNWTLEDLLTHSAANYGFRTPEDEYLSAAIGAIEMLKTGCTSAYDLYMAVPAITDEAFEAVVRAYTDVGVRVVLAPAVADVTFYQTVPGLADLLPADLRKTVEEMKRLLMQKNEPVFEAVAAKGPGVFETLKGVAKLVLSELTKT